MVGALNVFVFIMIISFVIERVVKAVLFVLAFVGQRVPKLNKVLIGNGDATGTEAGNRKKLIYTVIAAIIAAVFVWNFEEIRILKILIIKPPDETLDMFVTWLTVLGGSDFIGRILAVAGIGDLGAGSTSTAGTGSASSKQPIEITGTLKLDSADKIGSGEKS